jgi:hypothetical protein
MSIIDDQIASSSFHIDSHVCECDVCSGACEPHDPENALCDCAECDAQGDFYAEFSLEESLDA